jgi:AraC-like DNA-binding protein
MPEVLFQPFPMVGSARAQVWSYAPQYRRPRHLHLEPELNLVAEGRGSFGTGEATLWVEAGDLIWWKPGQDHELLTASEDLRFYACAVTPEFSDRVLGPNSGPTLESPRRLRLGPVALAGFVKSCAIADRDRQDRVAQEERVAELWRDAHALHAPRPHVVTSRTLHALVGEPDLDRDELAARAGCYPSELSRLFHRDMGETLTAYRTRLRLLRFIEAVDHGAANLLDAALEGGFGSYSQCHRVFQRTFGSSPRKFFGAETRREMADTFSPA